MVKDETSIMHRRVLFFDLMLAYVITSILYFTFRQYYVPFLAGLSIASINFLLSGIIIKNTILKAKKGNFVTISINFFRILTISLVGFVFFSYNMYCVIAYMLGFTSHFISLVLYAIFNKDINIERK